MVRIFSRSFFLISLMVLLLSGNLADIARSQDNANGENTTPKAAVPNPNRGITGKKEVEKIPCPENVELALNYFTRIGISTYFDLNKKVPKWWDDYLKSGIPMMIPNDYVTGKPYHKVDKVDLNDTTGFVYHYKNGQECEFEFVLKNPKTGQNISHLIRISQKPRRGALYQLNISKRDYCINFLSTYAKIHVLKHEGKAPKNLREMLKGEGKLIEAGWKWSTKNIGNAYFEWGMDINKNRIYFITEKISRSVTQVQEVGASPGDNRWTFKQGEKIPADVCVKTKFISSNGLYAFYKSFKS